MKVKILSHTPEPEKVISMAAKLCYSAVGVDQIEENLTPESIDKFLNMLISIGHESPLEHVSFTFAVEGISRACSHQIVRHRIASYSQQSQRYVKLNQFEYIIPHHINEIDEARELFIETMKKDQEAYDKLVEILFEKHYKYMPLFRRSQKVKRVLISKLKDKRDEKVREINAEFKAKLEVMSDDEKNIEQNNLEFKRRNDIRDVVREVMNVKADLENWIDNESIVDIYKKFMNIDMLSYLDLPAILYLMIKLDGKKSKAEIRHIVIDEAQDYSMLQFLVLQGLTGCRSYTIVGDVNQRLVKIDEVPAMLRLEDIYGKFVKRFDLNKSYRSTQQIMEYASKLLDENAIVPFVRKGKYDVEEIEINDKEDLIDTILETLEEYDDENYENIAVITKDKNELQIIAPELKKFTKIMAFDKADIIYTSE